MEFDSVSRLPRLWIRFRLEAAETLLWIGSRLKAVEVSLWLRFRIKASFLNPFPYQGFFFESVSVSRLPML